MSIVDEYLRLKEETEAELVAMQVGDFYEFFAEDARTVSRELGLKLSEKSSHSSSYDMAGVPISDLDEYVKTLVSSKGYRVAVADQFETSSGSYEREIERIVTPSTIIDTSEETANYLCSIVLKHEECGISFTDLDSGDIITQESSIDSLVENLSIYNPIEIIISTKDYDKNRFEEVRDTIKTYINATVHYRGDSKEVSKSEDLIREKFGDMFLRSIEIESKDVILQSVASILTYLEETSTQQETITRLRKFNENDYMSIDERTRRSLEISETMGSGSGTTLNDVMDKTKTLMGSNKLEKILKRPLTDKEKILSRQDNVSFLMDEGLLRNKIRSELDSFPHIRKIVRKCSYGTVTPNQVRQVFYAISKFKNIHKLLKTIPQESEISWDVESVSEYEELGEIESLIDRCLQKNPGNSVQEGMIKQGFNDELDRVIKQCDENTDWLSRLEETISEENGISHLSVSQNKTDGYYIQVGASESHKVPDSFNNIKSLKNSERFKTEELKQKEREIMRLEDRRYNLEKEIFENLVDKIASNSDILQETGKVIARLDAMQSIAGHSVRNNWNRPQVLDEKEGISIKQGRHPVVEQQVSFVPNGFQISERNSFHIITGPNMAGKSTYMRQVALIVLLAQCGSYVPCESAKIEILDSIFTRVGSVDEISEGKSTFMVEMSELSNILHSSTDKSLVILDEIGRGTSTVDGISIAQSTVEYLSKQNDNISPYSLFATHYHSLTDLEEYIETVENYHMGVESQGEDMEFTRKLKRGCAEQSYGVNVAEMAGVPEEISSRSREIIETIENNDERFRSL